jgi:hypothetical protein
MITPPKVSSEGCNPVHTHLSEAFIFLQIESTNTYRNVNGQDSAIVKDQNVAPDTFTVNHIKATRQPVFRVVLLLLFYFDILIGSNPCGNISSKRSFFSYKLYQASAITSGSPAVPASMRVPIERCPTNMPFSFNSLYRFVA